MKKKVSYTLSYPTRRVDLTTVTGPEKERRPSRKDSSSAVVKLGSRTRVKVDLPLAADDDQTRSRWVDRATGSDSWKRESSRLT